MAKPSSNGQHHLTMRESFFIMASVFIYTFIAVVYGLAAALNWTMVFNGAEIPTWVLWFVTLVGFIMAVKAIQLLK